MKNLDMHSFRTRFNDARDSVKVLTIFSPTCLLCQYGQGLIAELFEQAEEQSLKGFSIWLSIMDDDNPKVALREAARFPPGRIEHGWDFEAGLSKLFAKTLGLEGLAWDVYLIYGKQATWDKEEPPKPDFWMHQLPPKTGADPRNLLAPGPFLVELMARLERTHAHRARDLAFTLHAKALGAIKMERVQSSLEQTLTAVDPANVGKNIGNADAR